MSTEYVLLTEAKINNKWQCIDPYFLHKDDTFKLSPLYESNSRSYFDETRCKLIEYSGYYNDRNNLNFSHGTNQWILENFENKQNCTDECQIAIIPYENIKKVLGNTKQFDYCEIVKKSAIQKIEEEYDLDEDDFISAKDYAKLPPKAQEIYEVYSWDRPYGWRYHFKKLVELTEQAISKYRQEFYDEITEVRLVLFVY